MSRKRSATLLEDNERKKIKVAGENCSSSDETLIHERSPSLEPNESINDKFRCEICDRNYLMSESLVKHNKRKHATSVRLYACQVQDCPKTFPTAKEKQDHMSRHSRIKSIVCHIDGCCAAYTTDNSLNLHTARKHKPVKFFCSDCGTGYGVRGDLNQHLRRKHKIEPRV